MTDTAHSGHGHEDLSRLGTIFALTGETGEVMTSPDVFDGPALLYFGYTFCPDICPMDAARNAEAVDLLAARDVTVTPVFITVDPGRDDPETLTRFTDMLHPDMVGLTGTVEQIDAVARAYGVIHSAAEPGQDFYLVDHSTFTYLVLPGGRVSLRFSRRSTAAEIAAAVACALEEAAGP